MSALTDPQTFQLHDLAERDVRLDPKWRELLGVEEEEETDEA